MIRKFKALGLALVAVFAMSVVASSAAQAATGFNWDSGVTLLKASAIEPQKFTTTAGTVECAEVVGDAAVSGTTATSVTTTSITYRQTSTNENCPTNFGSFITAKIDMNGCNFRFNAGTTVAGNNDKLEGTADIICPVGAQIQVTASNCTIDIGSQNGLGPVYYENNTTASPKDVVINPQITNIVYTQTPVGSFLPCGSFTNHTGGTYTGKVTITGSGGKTNNVWVE